MKKFLKNKAVLKDCKIYQMLVESGKKKHFSFHTPGHKIGKWDITELSYSDNLCSPEGCIAEAEQDIANILGAHKSFILTDGSTAGVLSSLYAAKCLGAKTVAFDEKSHKSVYNGCKLLGLTPLVFRAEEGFSKAQYSVFLEGADILFLTSPTYYGEVLDLAAARAYCDKTDKILIIDGAHGGHLHFEREKYAGEYADIWVDGVHKSLPSFTQGAVVSARTERFAESLKKGVDIFRTTSPSYPIMASVEYAVKFPRNEALEKEVYGYAKTNERITVREDYTKLCILFGKEAFKAQAEMEKRGVYPEFCDGENIMFYLSPALSLLQFHKLKKELDRVLQEYPYTPAKKVERVHTPVVFDENTQTEWVDLDEAAGRICAAACGLFPPCTPLICEGERIGEEQIKLLKQGSTYGLARGKILVVKGE